MDYPQVIYQAPTQSGVLNHWVDCGTGHRPDKLAVCGLVAYSDSQFQTLVATAQYALLERGSTRVISGMALGWDLALAVSALELGLLLTCAVPFEGQEKTWHKLPHMVALYHDIISKADRVVVISPPGFTHEKMQTRNVWMVDHSDGILALHNGDRFGGTFNCLRYNARADRKPVHNYWLVFVRLANEAVTREQGRKALGSRG
jgi:uncharacterized phage-like protein YoqJ